MQLTWRLRVTGTALFLSAGSALPHRPGRFSEKLHYNSIVVEATPIPVAHLITLVAVLFLTSLLSIVTGIPFLTTRDEIPYPDFLSTFMLNRRFSFYVCELCQ